MNTTGCDRSISKSQGGHWPDQGVGHIKKKKKKKKTTTIFFNMSFDSPCLAHTVRLHPSCGYLFTSFFMIFLELG